MPDPHLLSPLGVRAPGVHAGIKTKQASDVGLLIADAPATAAACFTTNKVFAAPVKVGREHVRRGKLRGVVINSGNANACTGKQGETDARRMCALAAQLADCPPEQILPSSTGIIGHLLPMDKVERGIRDAAHYLGNSLEHALLFTDAILTTDTKRKQAAVEFKVGRATAILAGICKGAGMIGPRMSTAPPHATLLAYLTTDVAISAPLLRKLMQQAADASFNALTIDDHTSTNDTACLLASGASGAKIDSPKAARTFAAALTEVCQSLAYQIAADGEGATKVVTIIVDKAASEQDARTIARAIANSPLVKCAMHGNDPNWGRIVSAAGMTNVPFDPAKVSESLKAPEVTARLTCNLGRASAKVWTCDLSRDYVTINADYHT